MSTMNPMDKFLSQYQTFSQHEAVDGLSEDNKVALFGNFVSAMIAKNVAAQPAPTQPKTKHTTTSGATSRQVSLLKRLIKNGHLQEPDWGRLTKRGASHLIDKGLAAESEANQKKAEAEKETVTAAPQGEYGGSYSLC